MAYSIEYLPLFRDSVYEYTSSIQGRAFKFRYSLNSRSRVYHLDLAASDGSSIVQGVPLLPYNTLLSTIPLQEYGLTGYFILLPYADSQEFHGVSPEDIGKYYALFYVYEVE